MTLRLAYLSALCGCFLPILTRAAYAQPAYTELASGCSGSGSGTCPSLNPNGGPLLLKASQGMHAFLVKTDVATIGGFELFMAAVSGPGVRLNTAIYKGTQLGGPKDPPVATGTMDVLATAGWYRTTLPATRKLDEDLFIAVELNFAVLLPMVLNGKTGAAWVKGSTWQQLSPDEAWAWRVIGPCTVAPRIASVGVPRIGYDFDVTLSGAVANTAAVLVTGASIERWGLISLPLDLEPLGAPGCPLRVSIDIMSFAVVDATGNARFRMHVPSLLRPYTWAYQQWLVADKNANRLGLVTSSSALAFFDR